MAAGMMVTLLACFTQMAIATYGVQVSSDGTVLVADNQNNRIWTMTIGIAGVSILAGSGSSAFADGTGTAASFAGPTGVSVTREGTTVFVADTFNNRIRAVTLTTRAVRTLAGSGSIAFADGTGASASFARPFGLSVSPDGTTVFVADTFNNRIRAVTVVTGAVHTLAGSGSPAYADGLGESASFYYPYDVGVSPDGTTVFVADHGNHRLRQVTVAASAVSTLAGSGSNRFADGTGSSAHFRALFGVSVSPDGTTVFVADDGNHGIRAVTVASGAVTTLAGGANPVRFASSTASFNGPYGLSVSPDGTTVLVADARSYHVRAVTSPTPRTRLSCTYMLFCHRPSPHITSAFTSAGPLASTTAPAPLNVASSAVAPTIAPSLAIASLLASLSHRPQLQTAVQLADLQRRDGELLPEDIGHARQLHRHARRLQFLWLLGHFARGPEW